VVHTEIEADIPLCLTTDASGSCDPEKLEAQPAAMPEPARFHGKPVVADAEMATVLAPHTQRVAKAQNRKLGVRAPQPLLRIYEAESPLGDVVVDSLREMERADVGLMNSGGLRADLPRGQLTYGQVFEVMPFDNTVATLNLTGTELWQLLDAAYGARKGVFQISGLDVVLNSCPGPGRLRAVTFADGRSLQPEGRYRLVLPDFLARGGDGLGPVVSAIPAERVDYGAERPLNFRDALVAYWQKRRKQLVAPPLGRIQVLEGPLECPGVEGASKAAR
jgi:5'-nucleotidase